MCAQRTLLRVEGGAVRGGQARVVQREHVDLQVEAHQLHHALDDVVAVDLRPRAPAGLASHPGTGAVTPAPSLADVLREPASAERVCRPLEACSQANGMHGHFCNTFWSRKEPVHGP